MAIIHLQREYFSKNRTVLYESGEFTATLFRYSSGIEAVELSNSRGKIVVLPFMGQIIWDAEFDKESLKMKNMFTQPKKAECILDTYGCFAFHSGLIRNGCPGPEDDYGLHGEMPCAEMDEAWLEVSEYCVKVCGSVEYVKGFGDHYMANPQVSLTAGQAYMTIEMAVKNLASAPMPLQYMCHMNYAYLENSVLTQNIPDEAFVLRESIPGHVKPTPQWLAFNEELRKKGTLTCLDQPEMYNPEIVFFADKLDQYREDALFEMASPMGICFYTRFSTKSFRYATRWILYNGDQQVGAFVLPATCRPEGFVAAQKAGSLIYLSPGEERKFHVITGKR